MKAKDITFVAMGIALFIILSMCLRVPVFENYYLCLGYIVMTVYMWCFKWYESAIIGFFGVILYCIIGGLGFNGMPGWAIGNFIICALSSIFIPLVKSIKSNVLQIIVMSMIAIFSTFIGIEIVKSFIDSFIVSQPFTVRFIKNITSFISDSFVIVVSVPLCKVLEKVAVKIRYNK